MGCCVGEKDGLLVGIFVGDNDGIPVGLMVESGIGGKDGAAVVGIRVG